MNRREMLTAGGLTRAVAVFSDVLGQTTARQSHGTAERSQYRQSVNFGLTGHYSNDVLDQAYNPGLGLENVPTQALPPHIFLLYQDNKFIRPSEVPLTNKPGKYKLDATLQAFGISQSNQNVFKNLQSNLQLGFNVGATLSNNDTLSWLFMSAINVFLQRDNKGRQQQLTDFKNYKPTA